MIETKLNDSSQLQVVVLCENNYNMIGSLRKKVKTAAKMLLFFLNIHIFNKFPITVLSLWFLKFLLFLALTHFTKMQ